MNKMITNEPLVSIIMNCHNAQKYLTYSLDSIINQTYRNWELIFWDNNSDDLSPNIFKKYKDKRFKYFKSSKYLKLGQARNEALKKVNGEFIAFLDCDDLWIKNKLKLQIPIFNDDKIGIVICDSIFFNDEKDLKQIYKYNKPKTGYVFSELLKSYYISLETTVIRKSYLQKLDYYFDNSFNVIEEYDLFVRLSHICKLGYVDQPLAKWRIHKNSLTSTRQDLFISETQEFIKKISLNIKNFDMNYKKEKKILECNTLFQLGINEWRQGNNQNCRKIMFQLISFRKKSILIFILSFFVPFYIFDYFDKYKNGISA